MSQQNSEAASTAPSPATHGLVSRPFEGLERERDLVAMRQLVPAATIKARTNGAHGAREVLITTILPMAWPALSRTDGMILLGMQASIPGDDISKGFGAALAEALEAEPGTAVHQVNLESNSPRLQDLLDPGSMEPIQVHDDFEFWLDPEADPDAELKQSMNESKASILPTVKLDCVESAFWVDAGKKEHLRWVLDYPEDQVIDAIARLHARRESALTDGTKYAGSFRADGLAIPVWDLPKGMGAEALEGPVADYSERFMQALNSTEPLSSAERRARGGIVARQLTLR